MQGRARSWRRAGACSPVDWKTPGLHWQYRCAKASIIRSIFCASPGSRKLHRNCLRTAGTALLWGSVHPPALRALQGTQLTARPPSAPRSPQCLDEVEVRELVQLHEGVQDLDVELIPAGTKPEHEVLCVISQSCDCRAAPCPALPSAPLGVGNWWLWAALQPGLHTAAPPQTLVLSKGLAQPLAGPEPDVLLGALEPAQPSSTLQGLHHLLLHRDRAAPGLAYLSPR